LAIDHEYAFHHGNRRLPAVLAAVFVPGIRSVAATLLATAVGDPDLLCRPDAVSEGLVAHEILDLSERIGLSIGVFTPAVDIRTF